MTPTDEPAVAAIRRAYATVPFYAKQGEIALGGTLGELLARLPLLTREKVKPTLPKVWFPQGRDARAELASGAISVIEAGHARVRVLFDAKAWRRDEARALALHPRGKDTLDGVPGPYRDAVLWVAERGTGSCGAGDPSYHERVDGDRLHLNSRQDPTFWTEPVMTRMLDELAQHRATALLADPFYLDALTRHADAAGRRLDVPGFVALTRGRATAAQRDQLARVFHGVVIDLFAAREVGPLFVSGLDGLYHPASFSTHTELLSARVETPGAEGVALVVVTTLEREVQPLVRYVVGDLVCRAPDRALTSVEGQLDDALLRPDGALVTSGALDRAIHARGGAHAYQVTQRDSDVVEAEVVGATEAVRDALDALLPAMKVSVRNTTAIAVEPNGKLRTTRRLGPAIAIADTFAAHEGAVR